MTRVHPAVASLAAAVAIGCASLGATSSLASSSAPPKDPPKKQSRASVIARARVWEDVDIPSMDIKTGPPGPGAFAFAETVNCTYVKKALTGKSPKFACKIDPDDEVKVKFGGDNAEVYGEVAATRLLWALGFGADRMYPVKVVCRDCPANFNGVERGGHEDLFDPATIERKMAGAAFQPDDGWSFEELDKVDEAAGGSSRAQRDALKLLAVFMQHTDTKPQQQRLLCINETKAEDKAEGGGATACEHPFMLLNDVGLTFGRANAFNANTKGGMNLARWATTPIWKDAPNCVGNLPKSMTGTLNDPVISEAGRQFLADLMVRLTDGQLHDLFEVSRAQLRLRNPADVKSGFPTVEDWVTAFKAKRDQIVSRHCETL